MKILVVDDSQIMRNILKNVIHEKRIKGGEILEAPNGQEAFLIMEDQTIDVLFVDWNMPELNGLELVKLLRERDKYKNLPILMVTAEAAKYNVMEAIKAGVTDYITKPITGPTLLKKIDKYLNQNGQG
ncbi:MAG: response regulator [Spirochaetes bacterium]|nr:MAG: response regulator [Spirochaetota bacterium]